MDDELREAHRKVGFWIAVILAPWFFFSAGYEDRGLMRILWLIGAMSQVYLIYVHRPVGKGKKE